MAATARVHELEPLHDLALIDRYAQHYGQLPRVVQQEPFDEFMPFFLLWKRQGEFQHRLSLLKNLTNANPENQRPHHSRA